MFQERKWVREITSLTHILDPAAKTISEQKMLRKRRGTEKKVQDWNLFSSRIHSFFSSFFAFLKDFCLQFCFIQTFLGLNFLLCCVHSFGVSSVWETFLHLISINYEIIHTNVAYISILLWSVFWNLSPSTGPFSGECKSIQTENWRLSSSRSTLP